MKLVSVNAKRVTRWKIFFTRTRKPLNRRINVLHACDRKYVALSGDGGQGVIRNPCIVPRDQLPSVVAPQRMKSGPQTVAVGAYLTWKRCTTWRQRVVSCVCSSNINSSINSSNEILASLLTTFPFKNSTVIRVCMILQCQVETLPGSCRCF